MRQTAQQALILTRQIRETANRSKELDVFLRACARQIKDCLACEAVGIRVMNENGMIPFRAHEGFDESFYQRESPLSIHADRCLCISVVKGILDSAQPFATPGGSFCVSGLTGFHASTPVQTTGPMRKACNRAGFETLALVPIRAEGRILGLIHLADRRANLSARQWVETLEEAGPELGAAIRRFRSEQASVSPHEPIESDGDGRAPDPDSHAEIDKERKEAERALQAVKQELADLIEYSAIGVFRSTAEGRFTLVNPAMAHMFGYDSPEQMLAEIHDIEHQIYANPADREEMIRRIRSENAQQSTFETRFRRRDGTQWDANLHIRIISEEPGRSLRFEGFIEDITEQKKGQQALLQTSRMEATATLAGGIAHDFNNLMVAVLGNAELLKGRHSFRCGSPAGIEQHYRGRPARWRPCASNPGLRQRRQISAPCDESSTDDSLGNCASRAIDSCPNRNPSRDRRRPLGDSRRSCADESGGDEPLPQRRRGHRGQRAGEGSRRQRPGARRCRAAGRNPEGGPLRASDRRR